MNRGWLNVTIHIVIQVLWALSKCYMYIYMCRVGITNHQSCDLLSDLVPFGFAISISVRNAIGQRNLPGPVKSRLHRSSPNKSYRVVGSWGLGCRISSRVPQNRLPIPQYSWAPKDSQTFEKIYNSKSFILPVLVVVGRIL